MASDPDTGSIERVLLRLMRAEEDDTKELMASCAL